MAGFKERCTGKMDAELIRRAKAGDEVAFRALLELHYGLIYKVAFAWCGCREDAQDVAQEVCLLLARRIGSYRGNAPFTTWLYRVTLNAAKDWTKGVHRRSRREPPLLMELDRPAAEPGPERCALGKDVWRAIESLPARIKAAVILVCCEGLSHRQAAETLNCAEATVSWHLHQARKDLAKRFPEFVDHA